jgi:single-strand DNA-binding protein
VALANNDSYLTESGERESVTTFLDLQLWGKSAEALAKNGKKGQELFVEGKSARNGGPTSKAPITRG